MADRVKRLRRIEHALDGHKSTLEVRRSAIVARIGALEADREALVQATGAGIGVHGLYVALLAGRVGRIEAEIGGLRAEAEQLAEAVRQESRKLRLVERASLDARRVADREAAERDLADLLDARAGIAATARR